MAAKEKQMKRPLVLFSVMLGMFLSAIEGTIVATAIPTIVADLGGFSLYSWVFSSYLLTSAATILVFGKLADIFGRKPIFIIGVIIFLIGSTLAGLSTSMFMLIISRFVQGVGAGALMPVATTIVGDIYTKSERAKIQGYLSAVWGISAVSGPLLGGLFVDILNWRYVFWMNLPLGILAMLGIWFFLHEQMENKEKKPIDYSGAILVVVCVSTLMYLLVEGGIGIDWNSFIAYILISVTFLSFVLFMIIQKRAEDPMMPLIIWKSRMVSVANIASLIAGMIIIGVSSYLPAFVQGVMGYSATVAGFTLTAMSIGWPIAATISGRLLLKVGYRVTSVSGGFFLIIGGLLFFLLTPEKGPLWAGIGSFFIGIGMGLTNTSFIVGIQNAVGWEIRGIATASNMFMRSLGSAIGAAYLGGLLNKGILKQIESHGLGGELTVDSTNLLLDPKEKVNLSSEIINVLENALTSGLHIVYLGIFILAVIGFIVICFIPKKEI
ncbi:MDR family MFS transporter [Ornithinibacillus sp. 4-3]|uniref:MDR family MFS transporter n=1 Tax=Ornithinibacillus sp. 4-3 TaxID=3231488 RepID=A0AB39HUI8_9BACI